MTTKVFFFFLSIFFIHSSYSLLSQSCQELLPDKLAVVGGRLSCFAAMKKIGDTGILVRFGFVKETSIPREQQPK
jgi:hypothetical protein